MRTCSALVAILAVAVPIGASAGNALDCSKDLIAKVSPAEQKNVPDTTLVNGRRTPTIVTLNGNSSKGTSYAWLQVSGSPTVSLQNANTDTATFVAPDVGPNGTTLTFRLTVGLEGCEPKSADTTVTITNSNTAPVAVSSVSPADIFAGDAFTLSSAGSYDPDGDTLSYLWEQFDGTDWVAVSRDATATFLAPASVPYPDGLSLKYRLTVSDGYLSSPTTQLVNVQSKNAPPVARVTCTPSEVEEGGTVQLDGSTSTDDVAIATYSWTQLVGGPAAALPVDQLASPSLSFTAPSLAQRAGGDTMTFGLTVTDAGALSNEARCEVKVLDVTPPALTLPAPITAEAAGPAGAAVTWSATAHDDWDGDLPVTCDARSGDTFPLGKTTVSCQAEDAAGNPAQGTFEIRVVDTKAPALPPTLPNVEAEATSAAGAVVTYSVADADDVVDGKVSVVCTPASGATFALGTTAVACTATDEAGNVARASFDVKVVDTTAPALPALDDVTAEATSSLGADVSWPEVVATDAVDGQVTATCTPASGTAFAIDQPTSVSCTAKDAAGNTSHKTFIVTVVDTTAPVLPQFADLSAEATSAAGATVSWAPDAAKDVVDGEVLVSCTPVSGSTFALGETTVSCSATDTHKNTARATFKVTVKDTTPPVLPALSNLTLEATAAAGAVATFGPFEADDAVDGKVAVVCAPASGATFALGTHTVSCTATDHAGNAARGTFAVTVRDTTPPAVPAFADLVAEASGPTGAAVSWPAKTATDVVSGTLPVTCAPASGATFALGSHTVTCSATDAAGNTGTATFTVKVQDTTAPGMPTFANLTAEATGPSGAVVTWLAQSATDLVSGTLPVTCAPASGATFALGSTAVTCTATDGAGNTGTATFTVKVQDTTAPVLSLPADLTAAPTQPDGAVVTYAASASDLVDGSVTPDCTPPSGSLFLGTTEVLCTATDAHGNTATGKFKVFVNYTVSGFFQPVDSGSLVTNTVKNGATVPLKWRLFGANGVEFTTVATVKSVQSVPVACTSLSLVEDALPDNLTATGGTSVRYDTTGHQFIFNWQTPKTTGACLRAIVTFADGSAATANFRLK